MKFAQLESMLRASESAYDQSVLPDVYMVARIDGRGFTKLTKERLDFVAPFDERFHAMMISTTEFIMAECGFSIVYGYTQSDEISLLFDLNANMFGRSLRKLNSILAGSASAKFSLLLGVPAVFDCRISALPNQRLVIDYFCWRQEDAHRNALSANVYWLQRKLGKSAQEANALLEGMSSAEKNEMLFQAGINFNDLPSWQKRGTGIYWEEFTHCGRNPITGSEMLASRRRLHTEGTLPINDSYGTLLSALLLGKELV